METHPAGRESAPDSSGSAYPTGPRLSLHQGSWRGAKAGARRASHLAWPVAGLLATLNLALTFFAAGAGRGWGISPDFPAVVAVFLGIETIGVLLGAIAGAFRRPRPEVLVAATTTVERAKEIRWLWPFGFTVLLALAIAFGAGVVVGRAVDRRLADAIARADLDAPWRIEDLMAARKPVPDPENSAIVVNRVVRLLPRFWPDQIERAPNDPDPLNASLERLESTPDDVRLDSATAGVLRLELEARAEAVRLARSIADFDQGRFEVVLGPNLMDTHLPHGNTNRDVARLLSVDAAIKGHDGDLDGAIDSCLAMLGVARSFGDEPMLVSQLIRMKIGVNALNSARRVLGQGEPSERALRRLQERLLKEYNEPRLLVGLRSDRGMTDEIIRRIAAGEMPVSGLSGDAPPGDPKAAREPISPWGWLILDNQRAIELEWMNRLIAIADRPSPERPPLLSEWKAEVDRIKRGWFSGQLATLPLLFAPVEPVFLDADPRYRAELGAMVILLAAERHRRESGEWPSSIKAIRPGLLPLEPVDPFTGGDFKVERLEGAFLVHSIGPNLEDEQGACIRHRTFEPRQWRDDDPDDLGSSVPDVPLRRLPAASSPD